MDLQELIHSVRAAWQYVVALTLAAAAGAALFSLTQQPVWEATSKVFVSVQQAASVQDLSQGNTFTQQVVKSYADVVTTPIVLSPVINELSLSYTPTELAEHITSSAPENTVVLEIAVQDASKVQSVKIADAISTQLSRIAPTLTPATDGVGSAVRITRIQPAIAGASPVAPKPVLNILLGGAVGLLLGCIFAVTRQRADTRIHSTNDLATAANSSILGSIPFDSKAAEHPLVILHEPLAQTAEAYRTLRTNLQFLPLPQNGRVLLLTSSRESEGKTTSAVNLALAIALAGNRVLLIDADLRRPKVAQYLGIDGTLGLTDLLVDAVAAENVIQTRGETSLRILPAGSIPPNPTELLQSPKMSHLLQRLAEEFDTIVVDAPPVLPVSDAVILATYASGAIIVSASGRATKHQVAATVSALRGVDARILGSLLTLAPTRGRNGYGYGYGYSAPQSA